MTKTSFNGKGRNTLPTILGDLLCVVMAVILRIINFIKKYFYQPLDHNYDDLLISYFLLNTLLKTTCIISLGTLTFFNFLKILFIDLTERERERE